MVVDADCGATLIGDDQAEALVVLLAPCLVLLAHRLFGHELAHYLLWSRDGGNDAFLARLDDASNATRIEEAVRDRTKTVELKQVNRVLMQPHWRREHDVS